MIKLKTAYNGKGGIVEAGSVLSLSDEVEKNMVEVGNAEHYKPETAKESPEDKNPLMKLTKEQLLAQTAEMGITDIEESMTKAEIVARIEEHGKS